MKDDGPDPLLFNGVDQRDRPRAVILALEVALIELLYGAPIVFRRMSIPAKERKLVLDVCFLVEIECLDACGVRARVVLGNATLRDRDVIGGE